MGKRLFFGGLLMAVFVPTGLAATIVSSYSVQLKVGQTRDLPPIVITSTSDGDIKAEHGINIVLDPDTDVFWERVSPTMTGTAFDGGNVRLNVQVVYLEGDKVLHIPVQEDFEAADYLVIDDLVLRAGDNPVDKVTLGMDLDGDLLPDVDDIRHHAVLEDFQQLLNYYNVRYQIKCRPSGVPVAENDSACLWARIDLIYAQEITGEVLVEGMALTDRDLELMALRRKWPEMRYTDNCVNAEVPADYCPSLKRDLGKLSYFLD